MGFYRGAQTFDELYCRPTDNSVMRSQFPTNGHFFNAPSRWAIWYRLMRLTNSITATKFEDSLNEFITFPNDELESILAINTTNYDAKVKVINDWIVSDMDKLKNKAVGSNTKLIFSSYPDDIPINALIADYVKNSSRVLYIDNKINSQDNADFIVYRFAKKLYDFLKEHKIFKI